MFASRQAAIVRQRVQLTDGFVVSLVLIQLFACTVVALTVLALVPERSSADVPPRYRIVKLLAIPTTPAPDSPKLPHPYLTITELTKPEPASAAKMPSAGAEPQSSWATPPESSSPPPDPTPSENVLSGLPVNAPLSQGFGCSPYFTGIAGPGCDAEQPWFHDGIDLAVAPGTPVRAALAGVVIFAGADETGPLCGEQRGYGLSVVVDNGGGWQALYAHLSQIFVSAGQVITPDTVLGLSGDSGCTTGPHLHFGLRRDGELVDPKLIVNGE